MKATIIMPLIGYLILLSDQVTFQSNAWITFDDPDVNAVSVSWFPILGPALMTLEPLRLYLLYFGFLMLGGGSLLFSVFCPSEIAHYKDRVAYLSARLSNTTKNRRIELTQYILTHIQEHKFLSRINDRELKIKETKNYSTHYMNALAPGHLTFERRSEQFRVEYQTAWEDALMHDRDIDLVDNRFTNLVSSFHRLINYSYPLLRALVWSHWMIGFTLLAIPSLYSALAVFTVMTSKFID